MPKLDMKTRTARFFMDTYHKATIHAAIESAVQKERTNLLPGMADYPQIPVDVIALAKQRNIILNKYDDEMKENYAELYASKEGHYLRIGSGGAKWRKNFSIAHEIGHSLFFDGSKHVIGVLNKREIETEEQICHMFASALLMPLNIVKGILSGLKSDDPWNIFTVLEDAARRMQVSMPALLARIGGVNTVCRYPLILLCLRFHQNPRTGDSPCLRVDICSSLGSLKNTRTWHGKSVGRLNLLSAENLFVLWKEQFGKTGEHTGGRYSLFEGRIVRASKQTLQWSLEKILVDVIEKGKWRKEKVDVQCASCLYAAKGWSEELLYIISVVKTQPPGKPT